MSHAIAAAADLNAPPVTKTLAEFVSLHPTQGWSAEALTVMPMNPQQFTTYIKDDIARWSKVAKDRHIEIE